MTSQGQTESLDPITVEVVRYKLDGIANEMQSTLLRSSFSPIVKEGLDASASLFTADGTTLSQSCSIPIHLATLIPAVAKVLETYPLDGMRDGDIYILNDPYTGGTHQNDVKIIVIAWITIRVVRVGIVAQDIAADRGVLVRGGAVVGRDRGIVDFRHGDADRRDV